MTKNPMKVEDLYLNLPSIITVMSKRVSRAYQVSWERVGTSNFEGSRYPFTIAELTYTKP
jgi:hypothetical protein